MCRNDAGSARQGSERARRVTSWRQAQFRQRTLEATGGARAVCGSTEDVQAHHIHALGDGGGPQGPGVPLCRAHHRAAYS